MIVPGGFGRSPYLLSRLKAEYTQKWGVQILGHAHEAVGW